MLDNLAISLGLLSILFGIMSLGAGLIGALPLELAAVGFIGVAGCGIVMTFLPLIFSE